MFYLKTALGVGMMALSACATAPLATSHQHVTEDGRHWAVQVTMSTGVPGTPVQTAMLVYNKYSKKPQVIVSGNTLLLGDRLLDAVLALGPSIVAGEYHIKTAEVDCPAGTLCGTLVQVQNSAGASAEAGAESSSGS